MNRVIQGDCRDVMRSLIAEGVRVQCVVTSPPYWGGLRDYGVDGQLGIEREPSQYVENLCDVSRYVSALMADDGCLWLNVGDVYAASGKGGGGSRGGRASWETVRERKGFRMPPPGYKMKDLTLVPFQLADRLRRDGWYLRSTIIWRKPSAVEPTRLDRPSSSHEYVFLLAKREHYAVRNPSAKWWNSTVWDIRTDSDASHPAAMPSELAERCILAGSRPGDIVFDPFMGSGTVASVAQRLGRRWLGSELNGEYVKLIEARTKGTLGLELHA